MKKIYYIIIGITIAMFLYWVVSSLPALLTKFTIVTQNSIGNSSFSSSGSFAYKSTPERTDLIEEMISINSDFIKNPPVPFPEEKNTIKNFYKLTKCFPNFKTYYIAKLKVTDTLFNELPVLLNATSSLTELELQKYFILAVMCRAAEICGSACKSDDAYSRPKTIRPEASDTAAVPPRMAPLAMPSSAT